MQVYMKKNKWGRKSLYGDGKDVQNVLGKRVYLLGRQFLLCVRTIKRVPKGQDPTQLSLCLVNKPRSFLLLEIN